MVASIIMKILYFDNATIHWISYDLKKHQAGIISHQTGKVKNNDSAWSVSKQPYLNTLTINLFWSFKLELVL